MGPSTTRRVVTAAALALILATAARPASASDGPEGAELTEHKAGPEDAIREARAAVEGQRYAEALERARAILAAPGASARRRAEALEITAIVYLIEGRASEARTPLFELYSLAPAFVLEDPSLPPRVTEAFEAEAKIRRARAVDVTLRPAPKPSRELAMELVSGGETASVKLECRRGLSGSYAPVPVTSEGDRHSFQSPFAVSYCHAVALDVEGLPIGRLGTKAAPFEVRPRAAAPRSSMSAAPPDARPITSAWWFWAGLATILAAGATAAIVAAQPGDPAPPVADVTATAKATVWTW
jgi:hypothetical protein